MKRLLLLRHGKSSWDDSSLDDIDRPLSKRGRKASDLIGRHLERNRLRPELVLCSPSRRTRETLARIEKSFDRILPTRIDGALYEATAESLMDRVRHIENMAETILVIGHNPSIQDLALTVVGSGDLEARNQLVEKYPTGALATIIFEIRNWSELLPSGGFLETYVRPGDLT